MPIKTPTGYDAESAQYDEVRLSGTTLPDKKVTFEPCVGCFTVQLVINDTHAGQHTCDEQVKDVGSRQEAQAALDAYLQQPIAAFNLPAKLRYADTDQLVDRYVPGTAPNTVLEMSDQERLIKWGLFTHKVA